MICCHKFKQNYLTYFSPISPSGSLRLMALYLIIAQLNFLYSFTPLPPSATYIMSLSPQYPFSNSPCSAIIQTLVQLVINTIDAQHHRCKKNEDCFPPPTPMVHQCKGMFTNYGASM